MATQAFQPLIGKTVYLICHSVENFDTVACLRFTTPMGKTSKAFTLIELLITLVIAAMLVTIAVPNFSGLIQNNRLITQTNSLIADLNFARSEAIKRGLRVSIKPINGDWASGLIVKLASSPDTEFLHKSAAFEPGIFIKPVSVASITFSANGSLDSTLPDLTLCDARRDDYHGRIINIEATGRVAISYTTANCS